MNTTAMKKYPHVFQPFTVRGQTFKNHLAFSPFVSCLTSPDGAATVELLNLFRKMSATGVAYITLGDTQVDNIHGAAFAGEVNVTNDFYYGSLYSITEAIHSHGAKASIELSHIGRGANPDLTKDYAFAPSNCPVPGGAVIKEMDEKDMQYVISRFVDCAVRCERSGFDMIMLHSAHNNLLGQFLSPSTNFRTDEYGGSLENRMRFPLRVIKAVRESLKPSTVLEMRVSGDEMLKNGMHFDETLEYVKAAQDYVDIINFSRGCIPGIEEGVGRWVMPNYMMPSGYNLEFGRGAKKAGVKCKVAIAGGFQTLDEVEQALAKGEADVIAMAHALIADPELIHKSIDGCEDTVRPCLRCQESCGMHPFYGFPVRCAINPEFGRGPVFDNLPAAQKKKVVVIGGGPGGMTATQYLRKRGHDVVLFEESGTLGGLLHEAGATEIKYRIENYAKWSARATYESGADIRLNTKATADMVLAENPDEIIVATGSKPIRPNIPGIDGKNVHMFSEVDHGCVEVGNNIVFCGAGLTGMESAIQQAIYGKHVKIIDQIPTEKFGMAAGPMFVIYILPLLRQYNIELQGDCRVSEFTQDGIIVKHSDGTSETIPCDDAVITMGLKSENTLYKELCERFPFHTHAIGDCSHVGWISAANREAYELAMSL